MPNWCYNHMTVQGPTEDLERFIEAIRLPENDGAKTSMGEDAGNYDLALLYPTPKELADTTAGFYTEEPNSNWAVMLAKGEMTQEWHDELVHNNAEGWKKNQENLAKYGYKDWYDWNCDNWGTKWSPRIEQLELDLEHEQIFMYYETAWSPATGLIREISRQFPTLIFTTSYDEESDAYVGSEVFHKGECFTHDYIPTQPEDFPDGLRKDISEVEGRLNAIEDTSDSEWWDTYCELKDLYRDLRDVAETEATAKFGKAFPSTGATV